MFTCKDVTETAGDRLDGTLRGLTGLRFRLHLAMCRNCRRYVAQLRQTVAALRALPTEVPPVALEDRLCATFRQAHARREG